MSGLRKSKWSVRGLGLRVYLAVDLDPRIEIELVRWHGEFSEPCTVD